MIAILAGIRSSYNVGSIFRTADASGFEKIILCGITPLPLDRYNRPNKEIAKVALGAEKYLPWEYAESAVREIKKLKQLGYKIIALEQSRRSLPYSKFKITNAKFVLVLGNEITGLSNSVLKLADKILEIPMRGQKESLNVAVAFGIVAFKLLEL